MRIITDRKRAEHRGASGTGTEHHWQMQVSAVGLAVLVPILVYVFGHALGGDRQSVIDTFANPFVAILTGLALFVGMRHFAAGSAIMIEDYWRGTLRKALLIFVTSIAYIAIATGLFALAKIAL